VIPHLPVLILVGNFNLNIALHAIVIVNMYRYCIELFSSLLLKPGVSVAERQGSLFFLEINALICQAHTFCVNREDRKEGGSAGKNVPDTATANSIHGWRSGNSPPMEIIISLYRLSGTGVLEA